MSNEYTILLNLKRKAIDPSFSWFIEEDADWKTVIDFALKQGVAGITFDSYQQIRETIDTKYAPSELSVMAWFGYSNILEKKYEAHKTAIYKLSSFYHQHNIKMMLLKGYGLSLYWPVSMHRPSGDMDIYLFGDWQKGDQLIKNHYGINIESGHEHHTCFSFDGESIENHYDIVDTKQTKSGSMIDKFLKGLASDKYTLDALNITLPSPNFNTIFLIRHLGQHFAGAEATLRQVLDWGFFMRAEYLNVDWDVVIPFLKKIEIYDFFCCINSLCVNYLGFNENEFPYRSQNNALIKRVMEDILKPEFEGNVPRDNKIKAIVFKIRRFFANRWKRKLIYKESIVNQLFYGSIAHLRRWETIED